MGYGRFRAENLPMEMACQHCGAPVDAQRAVLPWRYVCRERDRYDAASFLIIGNDPDTGGARLLHRCAAPDSPIDCRAVLCRVR